MKNARTGLRRTLQKHSALCHNGNRKKYRKDLGQADQSFRKITFRKITVTMKWKMYAKEQIRIMRQNSK